MFGGELLHSTCPRPVARGRLSGYVPKSSGICRNSEVGIKKKRSSHGRHGWCGKRVEKEGLEKGCTWVWWVGGWGRWVEVGR